MPPAWRLAISSLSRRPSRTALLAAAVALSTALIVSVACALASINGAINHHLASTVGTADLRIRPTTASGIAPSTLPLVAAWPEVADAAPRAQTTIGLSITMPLLTGEGVYRRRNTPLSSTALAIALRPREPAHAPAAARQHPAREYRALAPSLAPDPSLIVGRYPEADDEIVVDSLLAFRLSGQCVNSRDRRDGFIVGTSPYTPPQPVDVPAEVRSAEEARRINAA